MSKKRILVIDDALRGKKSGASKFFGEFADRIEAIVVTTHQEWYDQCQIGFENVELIILTPSLVWPQPRDHKLVTGPWAHQVKDIRKTFSGPFVVVCRRSDFFASIDEATDNVHRCDGAYSVAALIAELLFNENPTP